MPRYLLIAMNGPTGGEGDDAEFNRWYNEKHKPDIESVDGNISVRRFRTVWQQRVDQPYISVSEFEAENVETLMKQLGERAAEFTDRMDRTTSLALFGVELDTSPGQTRD